MTSQVNHSNFLGNDIHPTVVITGDVRMGTKNQILPYTVLNGPLTIGDNNIIGPQVVVGSPAGDTRNPRYDSTNQPIEIGHNNIIREFCSIQKPSYKAITKIGSDCYLMQGIHLGHDSIIEDKCVITSLVAVGGLVHMFEGSNCAQGSSIHQKAIIGHYAIVGMSAPLVKNLRPFCRYIPGKPISVNEYAIKKFGFDSIAEDIRNYVLNKKAPQSGPLQKMVWQYEALHTQSGRLEY